MYGSDVKNVCVLVVGAGGIGCELLKNLVLANYNHITIVDLDTIDISNLNRQFLFNRSHVGKSKAEIARESVLKFRPGIDIVAYHKSIFSTSFNVEFFLQFDLIFNALDNQAARKHVNRLCFAAKKPLIESGTAGYLGQVEPILPNGLTEHKLDVFTDGASGPRCSPTPIRTACFECQPRNSNQRTFPACTIRNTPSEPIHCVIWAKYLFNQLFGEPDVNDEDVSPDLADPEVHQTNGTNSNDSGLTSSTTGDGARPALRAWYKDLAKASDSPSLQTPSQPSTAERILAWRLFHDDIILLVGMRDLWVDRQDRREPTPLDSATMETALSTHSDEPTKPSQRSPATVPTDATDKSLRDQRCHSLAGWLYLFLESTLALRRRLAGDSTPHVLTWDKDDDDAMNFVASASVLRSMLFHLPGADQLTRFTIKSLAGNIVPAIATTNAIIAGLMVLQAHHILSQQVKHIRTIYLHRHPTGRRGRRRLVVPCDPPEPSVTCLVCSDEANRGNLTLVISDPSVITLRQLRDRLLIRELGMLAPDVEYESRGVILISSEEGETDEETLNKSLSDFQVTSGCRLRCDDFRQEFTIRLLLKVDADFVPGEGEGGRGDEPWRILGDISTVLAEAQSKMEIHECHSTMNGDAMAADEVIDPSLSPQDSSRKRSLSVQPHSDIEESPSTPKRAHLDQAHADLSQQAVMLHTVDEDDELVMLD